jgi:hypothetical protein
MMKLYRFHRAMGCSVFLSIIRCRSVRPNAVAAKQGRNLPHHLEVTLFQLLGLSNWCDRAYAGEVETCPREFSRSVVSAIINVRKSLPSEMAEPWDEMMKRIQTNYRDERGADHPMLTKMTAFKEADRG